MEKNAVRHSLKGQRSLLSKDKALFLSDALQQRFIASPLYCAAESIAIYSSFMGEVDTSRLVMQAIADGKRIAMPRLAKGLSSMDFIFIEGEDSLSKGAYGIKEPLFDENRVALKPDIDVFVIPGVAYDLLGRRIGMGKGYYDRALVGVNREKLVGFAYDFQILEEVPSEAHDIRVGAIVTEKRIIKCFIQ